MIDRVSRLVPDVFVSFGQSGGFLGGLLTKTLKFAVWLTLYLDDEEIEVL